MRARSTWDVHLRGEYLVGQGNPPPVPTLAVLRQRQGRNSVGMVLPLHVRFARLEGRSDEALRQFAQQYGLLSMARAIAQPYVDAVQRVETLLQARPEETLGELEGRIRQEQADAVSPELVVEVVRDVLRRRQRRQEARELLREWRRYIAHVAALCRLAAFAEALRKGGRVEVASVAAALDAVAAPAALAQEVVQAGKAGARVLLAVIGGELERAGPWSVRWVPGDDGLEYRVQSATPLQAIYASLAIHLAGGIAHRLCENCGRPIVAPDDKRRYCPPEPGQGESPCSQQRRSRRYRKKRRAAA